MVNRKTITQNELDAGMADNEVYVEDIDKATNQLLKQLETKE